MRSVNSGPSKINATKLAFFAAIVILLVCIVMIVRRDFMNGITYVAILGTGFALLGTMWRFALLWLRTHLLRHQPGDERRRIDVYDFFALLVGIGVPSTVVADGLYSTLGALVFFSFSFLPLPFLRNWQNQKV